MSGATQKGEGHLNEEYGDLGTLVGDKNSKFFHRWFNHRNNSNFINIIRKEDGNIISSQASLELEAMRHFQDQYKDQELDFQV